MKYRHSRINTQQVTLSLMEEFLTLHGQSETMAKLSGMVIFCAGSVKPLRVKLNEGRLYNS